MQIEENKVVLIEYTVKTEEGVLVDTSEGNEPLAYLHGHRNIIPGLENALAGKKLMMRCRSMFSLMRLMVNVMMT